jgi:folate-dependent phosphoribosylglycinamide formyltransferase PurN
MVPINHDDSLDDLAQRIHDVEHRLLVATVAQLCSVPPDRRIR